LRNLPAIGLDFGTTNTVLARLDADGQVRAQQFQHGDETFSAFRSVLALWQEDEAHGRSTFTEAGPWAIERFIADPMECRFVQSFKTFAASKAFQHTTMVGRRYEFHDLLAAFFRKFCEHTGELIDDLPSSIVLGRPVTFAGGNPDARLAAQRYEAAFSQFGFDTFHHVYEPVAAAFYFAQRLKTDATVLVADFGGGTSDFSLIHFEQTARGVHAKPLSQTGVGIAGDTFDYRIIDAIVSPRLGKGTQYKSWGKVLDVPVHYYTNFARWNQLSILKSARLLTELKQLARDSLEPEKLEALIAFIEADVGYPLYKAISDVKIRLSNADSARFQFGTQDVMFDQVIKRQAFESWISRDLERIELAVNAALNRAGLTAKQVDKVFLTGGSSFVPAVRQQFEKRFGKAKIETGEQLLSIAYGLALIGQEEDIGRWTARLDQEPEQVVDDED
jgi:hypothetical chaperone protein